MAKFVPKDEESVFPFKKEDIASGSDTFSATTYPETEADTSSTIYYWEAEETEESVQSLSPPTLIPSNSQGIGTDDDSASIQELSPPKLIPMSSKLFSGGNKSSTHWDALKVETDEDSAIQVSSPPVFVSKVNKYNAPWNSQKVDVSNNKDQPVSFLGPTQKLYYNDHVLSLSNTSYSNDAENRNEPVQNSFFPVPDLYSMIKFGIDGTHQDLPELHPDVAGTMPSTETMPSTHSEPNPNRPHALECNRSYKPASESAFKPVGVLKDNACIPHLSCYCRPVSTVQGEIPFIYWHCSRKKLLLRPVIVLTRDPKTRSLSCNDYHDILISESQEPKFVEFNNDKLSSA